MYDADFKTENTTRLRDGIYRNVIESIDPSKCVYGRDALILSRNVFENCRQHAVIICILTRVHKEIMEHFRSLLIERT